MRLVVLFLFACVLSNAQDNLPKETYGACLSKKAGQNLECVKIEGKLLKNCFETRHTGDTLTVDGVQFINVNECPVNEILKCEYNFQEHSIKAVKKFYGMAPAKGCEN
jgi:hypothetical protein